MKQRKMQLWLLIISLMAILISACAPAPVIAPSKEAQMRMHVLDVGQGDATLIELPDGRTMLVDAGEREYGDFVISYIRQLGIKRLDVVVGTHPHSDHIGGLSQVIDAFAVGQVWLPKKASTTVTFEKLLKSIKNKGLTVQTAKAGKQIIANDDLLVELLSPTQDDYGDEMNLYSAVVKITYGQKRFLIMGDAETENEEQMKNVAADVIRIGHHGSKTSSGDEFVRRVGADIAIVSVGKGNSYGLPKAEIIRRWELAGARVLRTDEMGSIVLTSDGKTIKMGDSVVLEQMPSVPEPQTKWVLNTSSKRIHTPDCTSVARIKESNKKESVEDAQTLLAQGYVPCGTCDPIEQTEE